MSPRWIARFQPRPAPQSKRSKSCGRTSRRTRKEARKIHNGEAPERAIRGEAKLQDAKALIEDGVPVTPLPFMPKGKTN